MMSWNLLCLIWVQTHLLQHLVGCWSWPPCHLICSVKKWPTLWKLERSPHLPQRHHMAMQRLAYHHLIYSLWLPLLPLDFKQSHVHHLCPHSPHPHHFISIYVLFKSPHQVHIPMGSNQPMIFEPPYLVHIPIGSNQPIWFKFSQVYSFLIPYLQEYPPSSYTMI